MLVPLPQPPDSGIIQAWLYAVGTIVTGLVAIYIAVQQKINAAKADATAKTVQDTNNMVNGQHGKALDTIVKQAQQIATLAPSPAAVQSVADAEKAAADHAQTRPFVDIKP